MTQYLYYKLCDNDDSLEPTSTSEVLGRIDVNSISTPWSAFNIKQAIADHENYPRALRALGATLWDSYSQTTIPDSQIVPHPGVGELFPGSEHSPFTMTFSGFVKNKAKNFAATWKDHHQSSNESQYFNVEYIFTLGADVSGNTFAIGNETRKRTRTSWKSGYATSRNKKKPVGSTAHFELSDFKVTSRTTITFTRVDTRPGYEAKWRMKGTLTNRAQTLTVSVVRAYNDSDHLPDKVFQRV